MKLVSYAFNYVTLSLHLKIILYEPHNLRAFHFSHVFFCSSECTAHMVHYRRREHRLRTTMDHKT